MDFVCLPPVGMHGNVCKRRNMGISNTLVLFYASWVCGCVSAGTGKTLLARAAAAECGASFLALAPSSVASKWLGDGVRSVRAAFSLAAKLAPCVLFVDEVRLSPWMFPLQTWTGCMECVAVLAGPSAHLHCAFSTVFRMSGLPASRLMPLAASASDDQELQRISHTAACMHLTACTAVDRCMPPACR